MYAPLTFVQVDAARWMKTTGIRRFLIVGER
ncbi:hypothetical protein DFO55_104242 [Grimontella sp. AG753]|jgi:hypothetical protein|uniref:Uncharacterized protein n=1 Tax=Phytobacter diazotrophicus TaxID=395631 RepID=A0ABM7VVJ3_9ENTR|nr:hypothetical protein DFO55_104242 [Grimontella sp. AG753]TCW48036.1 hypothetical protein EDC53_105168 [Phytobacter diazotrophicus]BDD51226.1 hypothetical protein PDTA9734_27130 [Phytobacter diazotrophicus]BEG82255.1 hypothetical protein PDTA9730_27110 [Phytobacter diazotrophicus]BEG88057.1 hypothetical protein PDTA9759_27130 [Phytobacter diazotrophicus]